MSVPSRRRTFAPEAVLGLAVFAGLLPLLAYGPYYFAIPQDVVSAAAAEGYSSRAAYLLAAGWLTLGILAAAWLSWRSPGRPLMTPVPLLPPANSILSAARGGWWVAATAFLFMALIYFPPFLAATGPLSEDQIHLTALHRMLGGQRPYVDFEFLYGPLMLYAAAAWTHVFGYTLLSFYTYVALLEAVQLAIVVAVVWWLIPERRWRILALAVLAGLLFNALVGPNWSASRRLAGLLGLLMVASNPLGTRNIVGAATLFGVQLAYSHDFGVAALAGAGAMYALVLGGGSWRRAVFAGVGVLIGAAVVWFVTTWLLLGGVFRDYLAETIDLMARFSAGEAGFRFYWTVNSLAVFAVLVFACVVLGVGLAGRRGVRPARADLLLAGGFVFALVGLKSGLNRADLWHLNASLVPLTLALLMPSHRRFAYSARARVLAGVLLAVISATYFFGLLPSVSVLASGWSRGAVAIVAPDAGPAAVQPPRTRAPMLGAGRRDANSTMYRLAELLHRPELAGRPVLFYADTWALGQAIGVSKTDPINDDFLYSDERGLRVRAYLEENPDALVLMSESVYQRLYGVSDPTAFPEHLRRFRPTPAKRIANWMSTTHYRGLEWEVRLKDERWRRTVGDHVRARYHALAQVGRFVVLAPS